MPEHNTRAGDIGIEEIPREELPEFWELHLRYLTEDGIITDPEDIEYFAGEEYRGILTSRVGRAEDPHRMVYFLRDGRRIGAASYGLFHDEGDKCFLMDFWVFPPFRGNGTGHRCFEALEARARAQGARCFELNSAKPDSARFWKSLGFVETGVDEDGLPLLFRE